MFRYPYELLIAWMYNIRAKRMLKRFHKWSQNKEHHMFDRVRHNDVYVYLKRDRQRFKGCIEILRDQVAFFYRSIRKYAQYDPIDYSRGKEHYFKNIQLGVYPDLPTSAYKNQWVTVVSNIAAWKGKKYGEFRSIETLDRHFKPRTFLVNHTYKYAVDGVGESSGWDKNQIRFATEEEIAAEIDKRFILSEN